MKFVLKDVRRSRINMTKEIGKCIQQVRKQNKENNNQQDRKCW